MTNDCPRYRDLCFLESAQEGYKRCPGPHSRVIGPIPFGILSSPRELEVRTDAYGGSGPVLPRLDSDAYGLPGGSELADRGTKHLVQGFVAYSPKLFWYKSSMTLELRSTAAATK